MKQRYNYNTLYPKIQSDPDIESTEGFDAFVETEIVSKLSTNTELQNYNRPADIDEIRGAIARPGFQSKLRAETLTNSPNELDEYEVYRDDRIPLRTYKQMERDPVVQLSLLILKGWITGLKHSISCPDKKIKAVTEHILNQVYTDLVRDLLQAVVYGFAFAEKVWRRQELMLEEKDEQGEAVQIFRGKVVSFRKIKSIDPLANLKYYKSNKTDELSRVTQQQNIQGEITVEREKLVWFALDKKYSEIFGNSRLKNIYDDWYFSKINKQQMLRHVQRVGSPPLEIRYPEGYSRQADGTLILNKSIAVEMGETFLNQAVLVAPSEMGESGEHSWKVGFQEVPNVSTDVFLNILDFMSKRMSDGIGVPSSLTQQGGTTFAEAQAQAEMLVVVVEDLVEQLECVIQRDVVDNIVAYNFGPEYIAQAKFAIDKSGLGRRALFRDIFVNALRISGSKTDMVPSMYPDLGGMMDELGIPKGPFFDQHSLFQSEGGVTDPNTQTQKDERDNDPDQNRPNVSPRRPDSEGDQVAAKDRLGE